jgi:hypothetical protein
MEPIKMVDRASKKRAIIDLLASKYADRLRKKKPRALYSEDEKAVITEMLHDAKGNVQIVADACRIGGFSSLDRSTVQRIQQGRTASLGKPVNTEFEKLVVSVARSKTTSGNVTLSILQTTAKSVLKEFPQFQTCAIVQRLQFSTKWATGIFRRHFVGNSMSSKV